MMQPKRDLELMTPPRRLMKALFLACHRKALQLRGLSAKTLRGKGNDWY